MKNAQFYYDLVINKIKKLDNFIKIYLISQKTKFLIIKHKVKLHRPNIRINKFEKILKSSFKKSNFYIKICSLYFFFLLISFATNICSFLLIL